MSVDAALILGPTGLAFDAASDTLYAASTNDNAIYAVAHASQKTGAGGRGRVVFSDEHLRGPLALRFAPNGDLLAANGDCGQRVDDVTNSLAVLKVPER